MVLKTRNHNYMPSLVLRLTCASFMKNSLVTIVDFLGPKSNYPAGIRDGQSYCTEDVLETLEQVLI